MGIAYVIKEYVKNELERNELPIELPNIRIFVAYIRGELNKIDKKFINDYIQR